MKRITFKILTEIEEDLKTKKKELEQDYNITCDICKIYE